MDVENEIEEMDDIVAKTEIIEDDAGASQDVEKSAEAKSSDANDANKPEDTLSVVRNVVDERKSPEASSAAASEAGTDAGAKVSKKEPDDVDFTDVPFHKHPRFQSVLGRMRAAETDAQRYQNVERFIDEQGLSGDEVRDLIEIGGLMKSDPAKAWERMMPIVRNVMVAAGAALPPDLNERVARGEMNRDVALELSRQRATAQTLEGRQRWEAERAAARAEADAKQAGMTAASDWESERREKDPNFDAKYSGLVEQVQWLQAKGWRPTDPEGVKAQLQQAYDKVSATYVPPAPRKKAIRPVTGGQVNGAARPAPRSTMDIINSVVAQRGAA